MVKIILMAHWILCREDLLIQKRNYGGRRRKFMEVVLNSITADVPKAVVLCQVEKAKQDMLNQLYISISGQSTARIENLLQEDQVVKRRREAYPKTIRFTLETDMET